MINKIELRSEEEQTREAERQLEYIEEARKIVSEISEKLGRPLFSHTKTFGCEMNLDSQTRYSCLIA